MFDHQICKINASHVYLNLLNKEITLLRQIQLVDEGDFYFYIPKPLVLHPVNIHKSVGALPCHRPRLNTRVQP